VMAEMTGFDFCKLVKETPSLSHIPFILITGSASNEQKLRGIEYGADDYITKPFETDMLVAKVQSLIKKQENLQKYFYNEITHQKQSLNISSEYKEFLEACITVVERNLDRDDFNIQVLANEMGMSHSKLYKKIKTISGQSANAFIRFIRLRKAAELFINSGYNVNETSFYVGIKDIKYFREQFAKTFGMKPSEYIEKYRKNLGKNYKLNEKVKKD
jgi:YesN/AraC family two-component response regulator